MSTRTIRIIVQHYEHKGMGENENLRQNFPLIKQYILKKIKEEYSEIILNGNDILCKCDNIDGYFNNVSYIIDIDIDVDNIARSENLCDNENHPFKKYSFRTSDKPELQNIMINKRVYAVSFNIYTNI